MDKTTTSTPYYQWLKHIEPALLACNEIPLLGGVPSFPWEVLKKQLAKAFLCDTLELYPSIPQWRAQDQLLKGLGENLASLNIAIPQLEGSLCWVMSQADIGILMSALFSGYSKTADFVASDFYQGFYHYVAAMVMKFVDEAPFVGKLSPRITGEALPQGEASFCYDVSVEIASEIASHKMLGRLCLSRAFQQSWRARFLPKKPATITSDLLQKVELLLHIEGGRTTLTRKEWALAAVGDFVLLDTCSLDPETGKGGVTLNVQGRVLLRGRIKQGELKLKEYPFYQEELATMVGEFSEEDLEEEDGETLPGEEGDALSEASAPEGKSEGKQAVKLSVDDLSVSLVVEVTRMRMSVQKLLELKPGDTLPLDAQFEKGIDLMINGRKVGAGELLRMGDCLGVRITELG